MRVDDFAGRQSQVKLVVTGDDLNGQQERPVELCAVGREEAISSSATAPLSVDVNTT
jgi:hypothetical protein